MYFTGSRPGFLNNLAQKSTLELSLNSQEDTQSRTEKFLIGVQYYRLEEVKVQGVVVVSFNW